MTKRAVSDPVGWAGSDERIAPTHQDREGAYKS